VSRATPLLAIASLALAAGCTDQPAPTAPTRSNATVTTSLTPTAYTATVGDPVILEGGPTYNIAARSNALGDVAGVSDLWGSVHAVRWPAGSTTPIDLGVGTPMDINSAGQLVGESGGHAALWTPNGAGGYTLTLLDSQLPSPSYSTAYGVNAKGQVVGSYQVQVNGVYVLKCFLWTPVKSNATTGTVTTLTDFGGGFCVAKDINSSGYVVGASNTPKGETHGFVYTVSGGKLGKIRDLTPNGDMSYATSVNESGQIAGQHTTQTGGVAAIWNLVAGSYVVTDLGTFTGAQSWAMDINDAGFVVGFTSHGDVTQDDAFFWQNGQFTLLPGPAYIMEAAGLSGLNGGSVQVIGIGLDVSGARTAYRWNVTVK